MYKDFSDNQTVSQCVLIEPSQQNLKLLYDLTKLFVMFLA